MLAALGWWREGHSGRRRHDAGFVDVAEGGPAADAPSSLGDGCASHLGSSGHRGGSRQDLRRAVVDGVSESCRAVRCRCRRSGRRRRSHRSIRDRRVPDQPPPSPSRVHRVRRRQRLRPEPATGAVDHERDCSRCWHRQDSSSRITCSTCTASAEIADRSSQSRLDYPGVVRASVAQWIELLTSDQKVGGSSPSGRTSGRTR